MDNTIITDIGQFDLFTATLLNDFKVGSGTQFPIFKNEDFSTCLKGTVEFFVTESVLNKEKDSEESRKQRLLMNRECFIIEEIFDILPDSTHAAKRIIKNCRVGPSTLYAINTPEIKVKDPIEVLKMLTPGNILFILQSVFEKVKLVDNKYSAEDPSENHEYSLFLVSLINEYRDANKRYQKSLKNTHQERIDRYVTFMDSLGIDRGESMELLARI